MSPTFISHQALEQKKLIPIMSDYSSELSFAYAIYPQTRFLSNKVRAFIDFLADNFGDQPYWDEF
jgi:DNA-binding transcriptional LysR family regulator